MPVYEPGFAEPAVGGGWHTGKEWIDSGSMVERINFVADELGNGARPGVGDMVRRLTGDGGAGRSGAELVDGCLELLGCYALRADNRAALIGQAEELLAGGAPAEAVALNVLRMIGATREYQFA